MKTLNYTLNATKTTLFVNIIGLRSTHKDAGNVEILANFPFVIKAQFERFKKLTKGTPYTLTLGLKNGGMFYLESVAGQDTVNGFEFDVNTFNEFGFSTEEILAATLWLNEHAA